MRLLPLALLLCACTPPEPAGGPTGMWEPTLPAFFDAPWPSDTRLTEAGTLDLSLFPNPTGGSLLDAYKAFGAKQVGFGTNSPIYVRFDGPLDPLALPTPDESLNGPSASVFLVDIDPTSPDRGQRTPILWRTWDSTSAWLPEGLLAVRPVPGFPLRPATLHALVVTTAAASPTPYVQDGFADRDHPLHDGLEDLLRAVPGLRQRDVALATVFTTTDPVEELGRIARFVHDRLEPSVLDPELEPIQQWSEHQAFRTRIVTPVFTHGVRPYLLSGGQFEFRDDGMPEIANFETLRVSVCAPTDLSNPPEGGWPVVLYQHGTGGYYRGLCDSAGTYEAGRLLVSRGFIALGIDQPLHGPREGDTSGGDLANFNILNPESGVTNFRQGAIDALVLARALTANPTVLRTPEGVEVPLDPSRISFMGHSQGGLTGALAAPFIGDDVQTLVISGAGGVLAITIEDRKDPLDFSALVSSLIGLGPDEPVEPFHPVLGLVQSLVERTDPANYAPFWFHSDRADVGPPVNVLLTNGTLDSNTPYRTGLALAAAARLPTLAPRATASLAHDLYALPDESGLQVLNVASRDHQPRTAGFIQWENGSHFIVFEEEPVVDAYLDFFQTGAEGPPALRFTGPYR